MIKRYTVRIQDRDGFERRFPLGEVALLGRQRQCDVVLQDAMVSRMHLRVECIDGVCWAEDLDSSHGTFKDGHRIKKIQWEPATVLTLADGAYRLLLVQERLQHTESNIRAILSTAKQLTGEFDLQHILHRSLHHLLRISGQERGFIMLPDAAEGNRLKIIVSRGLDLDGGAILNDLCAAGETTLSMSSVQRVFDTSQPIWVPEVQANEMLRAQHSVQDLQLAAILCLPLLVKGKSIGVVYLDGRRSRLEPLDRSSFETIVGLCAVAIERARLAEIDRRNRVLAAVGAVASGIAAEFVKRLEGVRGHLDALSCLCRDGDAKDRVSQIGTSLEGLMSMSAEILDFAEMGPIEKSLLDMGRFLNGRIADWRERTKGRGIEVAGYGPACTACVDAHKFAGVIDGLMSNSVKASAGRGGGAKITLSWEPALDGISIKVADGGAGIPAEAMGNLFEPRFSFDGDGQRDLGLAAAKKIVEAHGGTIRIESAAGAGTTVTIGLPAHDSHAFSDDQTSQGGGPKKQPGAPHGGIRPNG